MARAHEDGDGVHIKVVGMVVRDDNIVEVQLIRREDLSRNALEAGQTRAAVGQVHVQPDQLAGRGFNDVTGLAYEENGQLALLGFQGRYLLCKRCHVCVTPLIKS